MSPEQRARRQSIRIIVSEVFMVVAVIITVIILAFVVSGYWVNSDFKVERQGMLQISSVPTGADLYVDGETAWNQRTNTSKVLPSGEHTIKLTKEGYDSWSRTVSIKEGLLYRIHYPRLFLSSRKKESIMNLSSAKLASVSPNRERMLVADNTTEWSVIDLSREKPETKTIDVSHYISYTSLAPDATKGLMNGTIASINWSTSNSRALIKISYEDENEWLVLDVDNPNNSVNLTNTFNVDFKKVEIFDSSANNFVAIVDGALHRIDLGSRQISAVLAKNIIDFDHFDSEIIFSAKEDDAEPSEDNSKNYYVGIVKNNGQSDKVLEYEEAPLVAISRFYDDVYLSIYSDQTFQLFKKDGLEEEYSQKLSFVPNYLKIGHDGAFATMSDGSTIATMDMEAMLLTEWATDAPSFGWLDKSMIYSVKDGELFVYDFDGLNRRAISTNVSSHFPVTITSDKWLYYFSDGELIRETIRD